ncbi:MAG TPA: hypothetical protein VN886_11650 [Acidimicrobiales bacterium]|nr:hypothetical protein [Acidimicrobiales bacterium]
MDPHSVLALCHEHADAEAAFDIDRVLATLVPEPLYEFYPAGRVLSGWTSIERFYRFQYPVFATQVVDFDLLGEWVNERTAVQEYVIVVRGESGDSDAHRVLSMMPVDEAAGLLAGERLYCDEAFVRCLLGPYWEETRAVGAVGLV